MRCRCNPLMNSVFRRPRELPGMTLPGAPRPSLLEAEAESGGRSGHSATVLEGRGNTLQSRGLVARDLRVGLTLAFFRKINFLALLLARRIICFGHHRHQQPLTDVSFLRLQDAVGVGARTS